MNASGSSGEAFFPTTEDTEVTGALGSLATHLAKGPQLAVGRRGSRGGGMFTESLCGTCAISVGVGRHPDASVGRGSESSAFPKADADHAGALRALADFADGLRLLQTAIAPGGEGTVFGLRESPRPFSTAKLAAGFALTDRRPSPRRTRRRRRDDYGVPLRDQRDQRRAVGDILATAVVRGGDRRLGHCEGGTQGDEWAQKENSRFIITRGDIDTFAHCLAGTPHCLAGRRRSRRTPLPASHTCGAMPSCRDRR